MQTGLSLLIACLCAAAPVAAQEAGEQVFCQRCSACHTVDGKSRVGPTLQGVFGRAAGSTDYRYSNGMADSGLTWNAETLDAFLANPREVVPGTRMSIRLSDAEDRAAIIEFLEAQ